MGLDNTCTRKIALTDATWLVTVKGLVAGPVNLILAHLLGATLPPVGILLEAMGVGVLAFGVSLVLFIVALRHVGTARAGAYYSVAPFVGASIAVGLGALITWQLGVAAVLMGVGVWLHLTERHENDRAHEPVHHDHWHSYDDGHHEHLHETTVAPGTRHRHSHTHAAVTHTHVHYPDSHHQHH
ncbi:DMT family transporter [Microbacterium sp.]|uniref:DMT family transporter n=1 Tax=Microbacterium sp. TaxID=51671 RepID=UPI0026188A0B|nr:DMT family transporter [Microbacterium sp.]